MTHQPEIQDIPKSRLVLLSGFLGAGKTTLLKRIVSWEQDLSETVILVNEFGDVGIDGALLKDSGSDVIELTSGCICCTLSADLHQSLTDIWQRFHPRRILLESSGVADPTSILNLLDVSDLAEIVQLDKVITVMDADFWEAREMWGQLFYHQLETAHLILLNKIDVIGKEKIPQYLKELHELIPEARVVPTIQCNIDPATLWANDGRRNIGLKPIESYRPLQWVDQVPREDSGSAPAAAIDQATHPSEAGSADHFVSFVFRESGALDEKSFKQLMERLPWEVFRIKGPVRFNERTVMINYVGGKLEILPWDGMGSTQLVFIGWDVDGDQILAQFRQCVVN